MAIQRLVDGHQSRWMAIQQIGWPSSGLLTAIRVVAIRGGSVVAASVYQHTAAYMVWMWYVLPAGCRAVQHPAWLGCAFRHTCELAPSTAQMAIQQRSTAIKVGCAAFASLSALCFPGQDGLGYTRYSLSHTDKHFRSTFRPGPGGTQVSSEDCDSDSATFPARPSQGRPPVACLLYPLPVPSCRVSALTSCPSPATGRTVVAGQ